MFWKTAQPVQQKAQPQYQRRPMVTDQARRTEDRIVLEHIVGYIDRISREGRRGFNNSANKLEELLAQVPDKQSSLYKGIKYQVDMLKHYSDRMEYIDAHKAQTWDEMKYRNFIEQFCPREENENDDE